MGWGRDETRKTIERALSYKKDGDCEAQLRVVGSSNTRFARNEITTSGLTEDLTLTITSRHEGRAGTITTNDLSEEGLRGAVARAEKLRALLPPDPEAVEMLGPQKYPDLDKFDQEAALARAADLARGVKETLALARKRSLDGSGFYETSMLTRGVGNSKGNFGYYTATEVEFSTTMRTQDGFGSGWASAIAPRFVDVDPAALARRAADKGLSSAKPREIPPGDYTVILEPAAVANLMQGLSFGTLSARAADEGRSVFSKQGGGSRIGETVVHPLVTLRSDPFDPRLPGAPWGSSSFERAGGGGGMFGGAAAADTLPNRKVTWIEKGVLQTLFTDRYWARTTGKEPTPSPSSLVIDGGRETLDGLIASTDKGLLVTRFWYIRTTNPQSAMLTGLTRDGLFLIEKGKVVAPVVNLRFNESPVVMLQNVLGMTASVPAGRMAVPAIKSKDFTFTSKSDAV